MGQWTGRPDLVILVAGVGDVIGGGELSQVESSMGVVSSMEESSRCAGLSRSSDTTFDHNSEGLVNPLHDLLRSVIRRLQRRLHCIVLHENVCNEQDLC